MQDNRYPERMITKKTTLAESDDRPPIGLSPAERLLMMWQITQDCWAFVPGHVVKREFQRHVTRVERRKS
jgi:hypothetical protein